MKKQLKKVMAMSMAVIMAMGTAGSLGGVSADAAEVDHSEEITVTMMTSEASTQKFPTEGYVYDYIKEKFNINLELQPILPVTTRLSCQPCWLPDRCRISWVVFL